MIFGAVLVAAALSLFLWNQWEDEQAGKTAEEILPQLNEEIQKAAASHGQDDEEGETPDPEDADGDLTEMTEVEIDGYYYIGYISIPALSLELPVMSSWSYPQLKIAPCRYTGSTKTDDLVIAGHNYSRHFGKIKNLSAGDEVYFTDMDGEVIAYEVVETGTLEPTAIEEMTSGDYDLTLYTCTYGGKSRVTVRCNRSENRN